MKNIQLVNVLRGRKCYLLLSKSYKTSFFLIRSEISSDFLYKDIKQLWDKSDMPMFIRGWSGCFDITEYAIRMKGEKPDQGQPIFSLSYQFFSKQEKYFLKVTGL